MEGEGCGLFCSEVPLFEYNVATILSPIDIYGYTARLKKVLFISPWQVDIPAGQLTFKAHFFAHMGKGPRKTSSNQIIN